MNATKRRYATIKMLALFHRYLYWLCLVGCFFLFENHALLVMGIGFILYSLYNLLGYKLRWKHIYCSYQNSYRLEMTPQNISWDALKKKDVYGVSAIFAVIGIAMLVIHFTCL